MEFNCGLVLALHLLTHNYLICISTIMVLHCNCIDYKLLVAKKLQHGKEKTLPVWKPGSCQDVAVSPDRMSVKKRSKRALCNVRDE